MVYLFLTLAIVFEVGWAVSMKLSDGFTRLWPSVATVVMYLLSVAFLIPASKKMDIGVCYAIWAGCGVALISIAGMTYFKEPVSALKVGSIVAIVAGIVGLQIAGGGH